MLLLDMFNFCENWWLAWLLPFLLGLLLGWAIWAKWRKMYDDMVATAGKLRVRIAELESDLEKCNKERTRLKGELSLCEGRYRELELSINDDGKTGKKVAPPAPKVAPPTPKAPTTPSAGISNMASGFAARTADVDKYDKIHSDNLQIIEGIGPKMESVLKENGISSWAVLASKSYGDLKAILDKYGDKYRIIDPKDWANQAAYANRRDFDGLINQQKSDGSESKIEKIFMKLGIIKSFAMNDLKAVEGIGPKIEGLFNDAGITTWKGLSETSIDRLKSILEAAGPRYQLADPTSWPKQADYAAKGDWKALEEYQKILTGGRDPG